MRLQGRTGFLAALVLAAVAAAGAASGPVGGPAAAQSLMQQGDGQPVEINADDGIEWVRDTKAYIARGNARAVRGGVEVLADTLTAYYRDGEGDQDQTIFRVDADGNVRVRTAEETAYGDKGVYHVDDSVFVLVGANLRLETPDFDITARDSLEYWDARQLAVARGEAIVTSEGRRLSADVLTAHIDGETAAPAAEGGAKGPGAAGRPPSAKNSGGKGAAAAGSGKGKSGGSTGNVRQIDAFGNVVVATAGEIATGDEGVYNVQTGIATLCGNVKITRGKNQLNGQCAEVNLETGRSRLLGGGNRVRGLLIPKG